MNITAAVKHSIANDLDSNWACFLGDDSLRKSFNKYPSATRSIIHDRSITMTLGFVWHKSTKPNGNDLDSVLSCY